MYGAPDEPMIWLAAWFSRTIHTTCCHAGVVVVTPHGLTELALPTGTGAGTGAGDGAGDGAGAGCVCDGAAPFAAAGPVIGGTALAAAAAPWRGAGRGECAASSWLASARGVAPRAASASDTTPLEFTRWVTSIAFQWFLRSAPVLTARGPVRGRRAPVSVRSAQPPSEAWR